MLHKIIPAVYLAAIALGAGPARAADPPRLGLVIGNSTYAGLPPLPACAASVNVVSAALKRAGFDVTQRLNVSNGAMGSAILEFGDSIAAVPGSVAVAYFCGYAVGFQGRVFLLPASAKVERETDVLTQGLVGRLLVTNIVNSPARAGVVLLDTVASPDAAAAIPLEGLAGPASPGTKGVATVIATSALPDGPTAMAIAFNASIATPNVEVGAMLEEMRSALQAAGSAMIASPSAPAWLVGGTSGPPFLRPPTVNPPAAVGDSTAEAKFSPTGPALLNDLDRRRCQRALQRLGYAITQVDGVFGGETLAAIRHYQHEFGAETTGRLTVEQSVRLLNDGR